MSNASLFDFVRPHEISCELFEVGGFERDHVDRAASVHTKTCPHLILAQALQGNYEISTGDGRHAVLAPGEAFLTGPNIPLKITHGGDTSDENRMRVRWLHLSCLLFGKMDVTALLELPLTVNPEACTPFGLIIDELRRREAGENQTTLTALMRRQELAFRVVRLLCELAPLRPDAASLVRNRNRLGDVIEFMKQHLPERLTVLDLARCANLSAPRFHGWFHDLTGSSPMLYFKQMRLAEACRLLSHEDLSLEVIAKRTGFSSQFHFSRDFSRAFDKPPGRWRRDQESDLVQRFSYVENSSSSLT